MQKGIRKNWIPLIFIRCNYKRAKADYRSVQSERVKRAETWKGVQRAAVSPVGSVGASASQRCPLDTRTLCRIPKAEPLAEFEAEPHIKIKGHLKVSLWFYTKDSLTVRHTWEK